MDISNPIETYEVSRKSNKKYVKKQYKNYGNQVNYTDSIPIDYNYNYEQEENKWKNCPQNNNSWNKYDQENYYKPKEKNKYNYKNDKKYYKQEKQEHYDSQTESDSECETINNVSREKILKKKLIDRNKLNKYQDYRNLSNKNKYYDQNYSIEQYEKDYGYEDFDKDRLNNQSIENKEIIQKTFTKEKNKALISNYIEEEIPKEKSCTISIQTELSKDFGCNHDKSIETSYYLIYNNPTIDKTIPWEILDRGGENTINTLLEDNDLRNKYFIEILKLIKKYSFVKLNFFQLKVINLCVKLGMNENIRSDYVRIIQKQIEDTDCIYFRSFVFAKNIKIFKYSDIYFEEKFTRLSYTVTYKLSHKLSQQFGIITNCYFYYQGLDNQFIVYSNDFQILEIINLLRQIYHIMPDDY